MRMEKKKKGKYLKKKQKEKTKILQFLKSKRKLIFKTEPCITLFNL